MTSSKASAGNARAGEERYRTSIREAVMEHLGTTLERVAWCEAALDVLWEYDELAPFEVAMNAWCRGDREIYEEASADDARLDALAAAAWAAE